MNYYLKKIYFSIMLSIVLVLTVVTTTFAWYATNQHTTIDTIDISITGQGYSLATDKGIILSVDGINFKNNLDSLDLKKAILLKKGYSNAFYLSEDEINQI